MTKSLNEYPDILTADDLMAILDISRCTAYKLLRNGSIPAIKIGKQYRILKKVLADFLSSNYAFGNDGFPQ